MKYKITKFEAPGFETVIEVSTMRELNREVKGDEEFSYETKFALIML